MIHGHQILRIVQLSTCTATFFLDPLLGWGYGRLSVECGQNQPVSWIVMTSFVITSELDHHYCMSCLAWSLPSIYLVSVVFGTAIPTSLNILGNVFHTCVYIR